VRILISAYAFNPSSSKRLHPGEDLFGWKMVEQISRHHQVWVITEAYNQAAVLEALDQETVSKIKNLNIVFVQLPFNLRKLFYKIEFAQRLYYYLWQFLAWVKARELHRRYNFHLVHHLTFGNYWIPSFMGAFLPLKFIWGPVGGGQQTPKPLLKEFSFGGKLAEKTRQLAQWLSRQQFIWHRCVARACFILVCNHETKTKIPAKYQNKVRLFPVNGIDSQDVRKLPMKPTRRRGFTILMAGRLHRLKGFSLGLRAFALFREVYPEAKLKIIGSGPEEKKLIRLAEELGITRGVTFISWLPRPQLLTEMKKVDVFLFPSFRDGGGAVVIEAMACGKPVICLDTAGPGFHIHQEWGIKIPPSSPEILTQQIKEALEKLWSEPELRVKMGEAARQRVIEVYLWEKLGKRMADYYQECVKLKVDFDESRKG